MVKSTEGVLSAVPQLQTEEKHSAALSQLHWPVHHCRLNTLNKRTHWTDICVTWWAF